MQHVIAPPTPSAHTTHAPHNPFRRWAETLYCTGAEEEKCPLANGTRVRPGQCNWQKHVGSEWVSVPEADMADRAHLPWWNAHRWEPPAESGYRHFDREAAAACVRAKRLLVAGDSTSRDTFYMLGLVAGHGGSLFANMPNSSREYWPDGSWMPATSRMQDRQGPCLGNYDKTIRCVRDHEFVNPPGEPSTRLSFQFLMTSNASWELHDARKMLGERPPDFAFVQCPQYEWFKPDAYNYSLSREERARVIKLDGKMGERYLEGIGVSCRTFIERAISRPSPRTKVFHLGMTPLPGWTHTLGGEDVERNIFRSIHNALGLRCRKSAEGYVHSSQGPVVSSIDRFAVCGPRKRDGIHPLWNAQFAVVQLMLNHMCPAPHEPRGHPHERRANRTQPKRDSVPLRAHTPTSWGPEKGPEKGNGPEKGGHNLLKGLWSSLGTKLATTTTGSHG